MSVPRSSGRRLSVLLLLFALLLVVRLLLVALAEPLGLPPEATTLRLHWQPPPPQQEQQQQGEQQEQQQQQPQEEQEPRQRQFWAGQCGADSQRLVAEREPEAYVLGLRVRDYYEQEDDVRVPPEQLFVEGIGDKVYQHHHILGCALRHNLRVVCVPEMFATLRVHHTGNMGFLWGCQSKYLTCGRFKAWGELDLALSVPEEVSATDALTMVARVRQGAAGSAKAEAAPASPTANPSAAPAWPLLPEIAPAAPLRLDGPDATFGTRLHRLAPDGKLVFRSVTCQVRGKRERDLLKKEGMAFMKFQYELMFLAMGRRTPLWRAPADQRWRIAITVRRGDITSADKRRPPSKTCVIVAKMYEASGYLVNASNSDILVFSETHENDPAFACFRAMPNARILISNKTYTQHGAVSRWIRDFDHMASAHFFIGEWSYFSYLVESTLTPKALSVLFGFDEPQVSKMRRLMQSTHGRPFLRADLVHREPRLGQAPRFDPDQDASCCRLYDKPGSDQPVGRDFQWFTDGNPNQGTRAAANAAAHIAAVAAAEALSESERTRTRARTMR